MRIVLIATVLVLSACGEQPSELSSVKERPVMFPKVPVVDLTPGDVCDTPDRYRYPERIAYCERDVSTSTKYAIIREYDEEYGFHIGEMNRYDFKIDHYVSLCMGGSNDKENLWPQHKSVYEITDPLEGKLCRLLANGKMLQAEAIDTLKYAKNNLDEVRSIEREIDAMLRD